MVRGLTSKVPTTSGFGDDWTSQKLDLGSECSYSDALLAMFGSRPIAPFVAMP